MKDEGKEKFWDKLNKTQLSILVFCFVVVCGIGLTYLPWESEEVVETFIADPNLLAREQIVEETYEEQLEGKLEGILNNLEGAGQTSVMVTTSATDERVLAEEVVQYVQNTDETDNSGHTRSDTKQDTTRTVVMEEGDIPFVIKENRPEIEGVLVLAEGADNGNVKSAIIQAVSSVLDVPVHKIAVFKMASK